MKNLLLLVSTLLLWLNVFTLNAQSTFSTEEEVIDYFEGFWKLDAVSWMGNSVEIPSELFHDSSTHKYEFIRTNNAGSPLYCKSYVNGEFIAESLIQIKYEPEKLQFAYWSLNNVPLYLEPQLAIDETEGTDLVTEDSVSLATAGVFDPTGYHLVRIENIDRPIVVAQTFNDLYCTTFLLSGNGSSEGDEFAYAWTNENGDGISTELDAFAPTPGIYTLTVTNTLNGCSNSASVDVRDQSFTAEVSIGLTCDNFLLQAEVMGPSKDYTFEWSNAQTTSNANYPLSWVEYRVTIYDSNSGCQTTVIGDLAKGPQPISTAATIAGASDINMGSIDQTVMGGNPPYTFDWSNGEITEDIDELDSGEYTVTITDANGCEHVSTFVVEFVSAIGIVDGSSPISIYPNPSLGLINVDSEINGFDLTIVDPFGKIVYQKNNLGKTESLDLDLHAGVYFIKLKQKDHGQYIAKLILHEK